MFKLRKGLANPYLHGKLYEKSTTDVASTKALSSNLVSDKNINLNANEEIGITGSNLSANNLIGINTNNLNINSSKNT